MGIIMPPKPITELDRLSFVFNQIKQIFAVPKGFCKFTPLEKIVENEAFNGLSKDQMLSVENWQFHRDPQDPEIQNLIARGEAVYNADCLDSVAKDFPKNSWSIQKDVTGTVATLKSHLWQGFYAYHRCNTDISGYIYMGNGIKNENLPFMV
uniref:Radial spoke head protein 9 homolog n=1 Tax=Strombidium inclinatum TaxID=197538 RepID=A0A7S3IPB2_9SPIT|mmetsp:Transcript_29910/g.45747  ORF Transcript_29910/g.45747 Transcript_29910/m.45747 type:complete len:152 (+) Transcript_29910:366-821(+)